MTRVKAPRLLVAATGSGAGKTTIACGLLAALTRRGLRVQACKCGPDYLDPMFHGRVLGLPAHNLDLFLGDATLARTLVAKGAQQCDLTLIEGAMGYYDGIAQSDAASAYDVARATETPAVLVVNARGKALSAAAEVAGFLLFRAPSHVEGVILNHASAGYYPRLKAMIEDEAQVPVWGYVPTLEEVRLPHRHLGLVAANEVHDLRVRVDRLAQVLEQTVDIDALVALASTAPELPLAPRVAPSETDETPCIAVASDEAFNFIYADALDLLEQLGARVVRFSPLHDEALPEEACGLYLCGGYPELHARALSANESMRASVRAAIEAGMPTIAECGGFLYLHESLEDDTGTPWPMVGVVNGRAMKGDRLVRFGYATLTARTDSLIAHAGEQLRVHEFHYWESDHVGDAFRAQKPQSTRAWDCGVATDTLYAGFPHLYLPGCPNVAERFVDACRTFGRGLGGGSR